MNVNVEKLAGNKALISVELTNEEFSVYYEEELTKLLANAELKGFRKGKVPRSMYLKKFGEGQIIQNAVDQAISKTYYQAVRDLSVAVIDDPKIDIDFEKLGEKILKYTAEVDVYPEAELGQYFGVEVEKDSTDVNEEDINQYINRELKSKSDLEVVEEGALENGNTAVFDFEGFVDGVAFEGGKAENYSLEIGSGQFIPGFEEQMLGMKPEEERTITVTFPENYQAENLKGKAADFKIKLHEIKKRVLPELTDEFIKELEIPDVTSVDQYKEYISNKLKSEKQEASDNKYEHDVITIVCDNAKVDIPDVLIERRIESMMKQEESRAKGYGISFEQLLQYQGTTIEQYREMMTPSAKFEVLKEIVLNKIIEVENITLEDKDYVKGYEEIAKLYNQDVAQIEKQYPRDRISYHFLLLKTIELLKEKAVTK